MISLVVFLGNYGREYEKSRHNTAWQFADALPFADKLTWQSKFKGMFACADMTVFAQWAAQYRLACTKDGSVLPVPEAASDKIYFLKPLTYMNLSGDSISEIVHFYKLKPENVLIVHDEIELPLGTLSFKWSGGLGGHNGLRSAKAVLGTADFWRIRFGIGKPDNADVAAYVLSDFTGDERISLMKMFDSAAQLFAHAVLSSDPQRLIPEWGKKKIDE